jgi:hypothetical protein
LQLTDPAASGSVKAALAANVGEAHIVPINAATAKTKELFKMPPQLKLQDAPVNEASNDFQNKISENEDLLSLERTNSDTVNKLTQERAVRKA